jgi:hypothetical protein
MTGHIIAEPTRVRELRKALAKAQAASTKASEARAALPAGSTRARVTSANARWMRCAEERDRIQAELDKAIEQWRVDEDAVRRDLVAQRTGAMSRGANPRHS